jgi:hypothetical protein
VYILEIPPPFPQGRISLNVIRGGGNMKSSVADPDPFDTHPDPAFHFDTDPDPVFQFATDPDPTVCYGSGSLPFQKGNIPKTVLFIHLYST